MLHTLSEQALLVDLHISNWRGSRVDKQITTEVEKTHTVQKAGRYTKDLVTSDELKEVRQAAEALRDYHRKNTLPWSDQGERLLPAANFFAYTEQASQLKNRFETAVSDFIADYDQVLDNARRRLNGLFRLQDYPTVTDLRSKFAVKTVMLPVPKAEFTLALPGQELETLKNQADTELQNRIATAQADNWSRVKEQLERMRAIFSEDSAPVYSTLFTNLQEIVTLLPKLNITGDPALTDVCQELTTLLVEPADIRKSRTLRAEKSQQVDQILAKFTPFF